MTVVVEFGDGREPWSVSRRRARRWMHVLVRQTARLPPVWRDELASWLADRGVDMGPAVLVTHGDGGDDFRLHTAGVALDVDPADLPPWLQRPEPMPEPPRPSRRRAKTEDNDGS